jgi:xylan 1,4-beta-xylosidase
MNIHRKLLSLSLLLLPIIAGTGEAQSTGASAAPASSGANPVIPGDHPDPTILRIGHTYWMASTSGDWAPSFSLFRSGDLRHWTPAGAVFPQPPAWASGDFWAPELTTGPGGVFVFYAARKEGGPLCVAVASAPKADGPYTDHGPLVCQADGSIDPSVVRDKREHTFLVWKEDGNSIGKPTIIWAQPMTADLLHLSGERFELLRNDPATWEGAVVEGPYILRHQGRFYLFYAGNACCGQACHYAEGVARADRLTGPWMKDPGNPIIRANGAWRCPGHGTAVTTPEGKDYFLYHAYPAAASVYLGRESVLDAIGWTADRWPVINSGNGPGGDAETNPPPAYVESFHDPQLDPEWKWPIGHQPGFRAGDGALSIAAAGETQPMYLAHSLPSLQYEATVAVPADAEAASGIGLVGETARQVTLFRRNSVLMLEQIAGGRHTLLEQAIVPASALVWLRVESSANHEASFSFSYSADSEHWTPLGHTSGSAQMLAWDHGFRLALVAEGPAGTHARFAHFSLRSLPHAPASPTQ